MKIYLKLEKQPETIKELLENLYSHPYNIDDSSPMNALCVETYDNKECTVRQCQARKTRSYDDVKDIINTYFPDTTDEKIVHELVTLGLKSPNGTTYYFYPSYCSTINRITIIYWRSPSTFKEGITLKTNLKYCWNRLLALLDINNLEELYKYIKTSKNLNSTSF